MWIGEMRSQSSAGNLPTFSQLNPTYGTYTIYLYLSVSTLWVEAILHAPTQNTQRACPRLGSPHTY